MFIQRLGVRHFSNASVCSTRYGFVGLGAMGVNMAKNISAKLDKNNDTLTVFDVNPEASSSIVGAIVAQNASEVAHSSDVLVTMLPEGKHVRSVYTEIVDSLKNAENNGKKKVFIDCSTSDIESSLAMADLVHKSGSGTFVDAPVSGGTVGALNGTLTFMVGIEKIEGLVEKTLNMMGARTFACGKPGAGLAAKLANNYVLALTNVATSEGFHLANVLGLDPKVFSQIVNTSSGRSWSSEINNPVPGIVPTAPSSRDYDNGFALALAKKDLLLALGAAQLAHTSLPLGQPAAAIYETICNQGYARKDMSVIYKVLNDAVTNKKQE